MTFKKPHKIVLFIMQYKTTGSKEPHRKLMLESNELICMLMHNTAMGFQSSEPERFLTTSVNAFC